MSLFLFDIFDGGHRIAGSHAMPGTAVSHCRAKCKDMESKQPTFI